MTAFFYVHLVKSMVVWLHDKENSMIIVRDLHDALIMKNKLASVLRRSNTFNMSKSDIQVELDMIIEDLIKNIDREERNLQAEVL